MCAYEKYLQVLFLKTFSAFIAVLKCINMYDDVWKTFWEMIIEYNGKINSIDIVFKVLFP